MPRHQRAQSESDIYHVFARGVGRQLIFEDDKDRAFFLDELRKCVGEHEVHLFAWALMGNHFHLLLNVPYQSLSEMMRKLQAAYAQHFNMRHERTGHLFQGRFGSEPITSDEQLLAAVRYIHRNPVEAGLSKTCDYKWSSYRSYLRGAAVTETEFVLHMFDGISEFREFHKSWNNDFEFLDIAEPSTGAHGERVTDELAAAIAASALGDGWRDALSSLSKRERDENLRELKKVGLSIRQIERLTGLGRGIISRA